MRKSAIFPLSGAAALALAACSQQTQESAEKTANDAGHDIESAAAQVSDAAEESARKVGDAAEDGVRKAGAAAGTAVGDAAENAGKRIKQEAAEVEADVQDQPVSEAKRD